MAATLVQRKVASNAGSTAVTTLSVTLDAAPTPGNILVAYFADALSGGASCTASGGGGHWNPMGGHNSSGFATCNDATSAGPITATCGSTNLSAFVVEEWSGLSTGYRGSATMGTNGSAETLTGPVSMAGDVMLFAAGCGAASPATTVSASTPALTNQSGNKAYIGSGIVAADNTTVSVTFTAPTSGSNVEVAVLIPTPSTITDPSTVSGLVGWWKADAITGLADGAAVSSWPDSSTGPGTGAATQATGTKQPVYKTNIQNGKPVVRYAGGQALVAAGSTAHAQPVTVFQVLNISSAGAATQLPYDGADATNRVATWQGGSSHRTIFAGLNVDADSVVPSAWPDNEMLIEATVYNGTSTKSRWRRGSSLLTVSSPSTNGFKGITIGAQQGSAGNFLTGDMAEILVYSRALSESEIVQVENYLNVKWFASSATFAATGSAALTLTGSAAGGALSIGDTGTAALALSGSAAGALSFADTAVADLEMAAVATGALRLDGTGAADMELLGTGVAGLEVAANGIGDMELAATAMAVGFLAATGLADLELAGVADAALVLASTAGAGLELTAAAVAVLELLATGAADLELLAAAVEVLTLPALGVGDLELAAAGVGIFIPFRDIEVVIGAPVDQLAFPAPTSPLDPGNPTSPLAVGPGQV